MVDLDLLKQEIQNAFPGEKPSEQELSSMVERLVFFEKIAFFVRKNAKYEHLAGHTVQFTNQ